MKQILLILALMTLSFPSFAAKWNQLTGDELKAVYDGTVLVGFNKGTKYTIHNCKGGARSIIQYGDSAQKERVQTYPGDVEMCNEDEKSNRCYKIFQHAKKSHKLKAKGTNQSFRGKMELTDKSPDWCK